MYRESYTDITGSSTTNALKTAETTLTTRPYSSSTSTSGASSSLAQTTGYLTVLPPNHKLSTSPVEVVYATTIEHSPLPSTIAPDIRNSASVGYTLVGPITGNGYTQPAIEEETQTTIGASGVAKDANSSSSSSTYSLRPPYLDDHQIDEAFDDLSGEQHEMSSQDDELALSKPHVVRKLYELLVPSSRSLVGFQSQKFNLSALKFLVRNLLSNTDHHNETYDETSQEQQQQEQQHLLSTC